MEIIKSLFLFVIIAGSFQGLFLAAVLASNTGPNRNARRILAVLMFSFSVSIAHGYFPAMLENFGLIGKSFAGHKLGDPTQLLFGPLFYLYVLFLTGFARNFTKRMLPHFIPSAVLVLSSPVFIKFKFSGAFYASVWTLILAQMWVYLILIHRKIVLYRKNLKDNFSDIDKINLGWIIYGSFVLAVAYSVYTVFIPLLLGNSEPFEHFDKGVTLVLSLTVYGFGYRGLTQSFIFTPQGGESSFKPDNSGGGMKSDEKYSKSALTEAEIERNLSVIDTVMKKGKPYLDSELTAGGLAGLCGISVHHMSETLNRGAGKKFYDYVNEFRAGEFIRLMNAGTSGREDTLLALAFQAGFNSKATFNRFFKQLTGKTPSHYKRDSEQKV